VVIRGRPKSASKRRAILDAAGQCFLERGLAETPMDAVAAAAGVSKQTVYSHFESKEVLFQAVIEAKCEDYQMDASMGGSDVAGELLTFTRRYLDLVLDPEVIAMLRQIAAHSLHYREMARLFYAAGPERTRRLLAEQFRRWRTLGLINMADAELEAGEYLHETAARFKFELLFNVRDSVSLNERERCSRRRVDCFLACFGTAANDHA